MTVTTRPPQVAPTIDAPIAPISAPGAGEIGVGRATVVPKRREGPAKLTGQALYTDDMVFPGAWFGQTIRSTVAHARLLGIELDPGFDWSSVLVLTAKDVPGENVMSLIQDDQPVLASDEIRHYAEPVALLAAPDRETLRQAVKRITLKTEPLPAVFDPLTSQQEFAHFALDKGTDVDGALATADMVIEGTYRVGHQEQLYIENNAMIAVPR
ncbi:MAG: molybdopterin cofactor-binding domain-containing protein, partial [Chloroflexota bacterium]